MNAYLLSGNCFGTHAIILAYNPPINFCVLSLDKGTKSDTIYVVVQSRGVYDGPAGIDLGCQVIPGFGRHLGLTDTHGLNLM